MSSAEQITDIGTDERRIGVPFRRPVAVDLPTRTCERAALRCDDIVQRIMCAFESIVRTEMRHRRDESRRRRRADELALLHEWRRRLGADLETDRLAPVPVERHVAAALHAL